VAGDCIDLTREVLGAHFSGGNGSVFECTGEEATKAFLHRFAVAGAAVRYRALHPDEVEDIIALDVALRRNDGDWLEKLPQDMRGPISRSFYYGHFFCHVFHQDYLVKKGADVGAIERRLLALQDERGAQYPAEHNVGHHYHAKAPLVAHYRALDPGNRLNPGIGQTSRERNWQ
jgi:D-lactate dehydrogenase